MKAYAARLLLILLAICMRSCAFSQDRCSRTQSSQLSSSSGDTPSDRYLGLNEDGDFLMVGINGNDSVDESDDGISSSTSSHSLSMYGARVESTPISALVDKWALDRFDKLTSGSRAHGTGDDERGSSTSHQRLSTAGTQAESELASNAIEKSPSEFWGLNEDGDFLMVGINGNDSVDESDDGISSSTSSHSLSMYGARVESTPISALVDKWALDRFDKLTSGSRAHGTGDDERGSSTSHQRLSTAGTQAESELASNAIEKSPSEFWGLNEDGDFLMVGINGNDSVDESDDEIILASTQEWLLGIVPTLPPGELIYYAQKLVNIGFDPVCVSQRKLKLEDLSFMKAWHRRSFLKEATGKDNTF
mgnify:CR=1 FL=1